MQLSARSQRKRKIVGVTRGRTAAGVRSDAGGVIVASAIIGEAVDDVALRAGDKASAVLEAPDAMVAR